MFIYTHYSLLSFQPKAYDWSTVPMDQAPKNDLLDDEGIMLHNIVTSPH
jgi:hypothetical protein